MRLLGPRQRLLTTVRIEGVRQLEKEQLETLLRQKPNSRFPIPRLAIYNLGYTFYSPEKIREQLASTQQTYTARIAAAGTDSTRVGRLLQKRERKVQKLQRRLDKGNAIMRIGSPPVVYDSTLTAVTADQIGIYMRSKGFFRTHVTYTDNPPPPPLGPVARLFAKPQTAADSVAAARKPRPRSRRVTVVYNVEEGPRFRIRRLRYDIPDTAVAHLVRADTTQQLLHVGQPYDEGLIGQERARIENLLKNNGYYDFSAQSITLEADTSYAPTTVRLLVQVANPAGADHHQVYSIRNVDFVTDAGINRFGLERQVKTFNGVDYLAYQPRFSTKVLDKKVLVRPGDEFNLSNTIQTQRQLSSLDVFRYTNVTYQKPAGDSLRGVLDATINTTPQKRLQQSTEWGGTYVANKPGPFVNYRLRIRNAFGGAEVLDIGLRAGLEGQFLLTSDGKVNSRESRLTTQLGANVNLTLPQFLVPWRTNRYLTRYSPRTRLSVSYTYVDRQEYKRTNLEASYDYIWQRNANHQFIFTPLDISLVQTPYISQFFRDTLRKQPNGTALLRAFQSVLIPSFNGTSLYNDNDFTQTRDARYLRLFAELGGPARNLYTRDGIASNHDISAQSKVSVYDFVRLQADYRRYHKLTTHQFFVWRLNAALATALTRTQFNNSDQPSGYVIPYDRYVFAGGGSSVRAWLPRRLGTGSLSNNNASGLLEQPGEVLLEGSVEYRFPLYDFIYGAAFTDFGNVWTTRRRGEAQSDAQFDFNRFYREIAVGSGLGVRFDFTFLIIRLDFAAKVYDPTAPEGQRYVLPQLGPYGRGDYRVQTNIGIGYPF